MGVLECAVLAVALQAALATPQYGAGPSRPQKVWTTTPFPDELPPANNDVYQPPPPPQYKPQPSYQPQPQPSYQPQPQNAGQGAPPSGGSYWWASGSRPFSPEATGQASAPQPSAPVVSPGNPFLGGGRPQQPQALPQQPSGGYGAAPAGPPQTPAYDIPCSQPGQVCVGLGQCQGGYVAPGANGIRQGQCSSASQTCCQQRPQQPQYQPPPPQTGGYGQPPPAQIPRPQPPPPSYGGGYSQPQPNYQPQPTPGPYTGPLNTTPYPGCAAALKCVEETYCTAEGVMANSPQYLTREQQENRVPMSDCQNPETGIIGKCCRDPNYKDPWPGGMMMKNMPGSAPSGPGPVAPPPPPPPPARQGGFQDTCANSGGVCVPSQQCPAQSRMQPEQGCSLATGAASGSGVCCEERAPYQEGQDEEPTTNPNLTKEANLYYQAPSKPATPKPAVAGLPAQGPAPRPAGAVGYGLGQPAPPPPTNYVQPPPQAVPQPSQTPQPTYAPAPQASYAPQPAYAPQPKPAPQSTYAPQPPTQPAPQPTYKPQPAPQPAPQPTYKPQPAPQPSYNPQPAPQPTYKPQPAPQPAPQPTPTYKPQPAPQPTYNPQPAPQPAPQPTYNPQPAPQPTYRPQPPPQPAPPAPRPTYTPQAAPQPSYAPQPPPQPTYAPQPPTPPAPQPPQPSAQPPQPTYSPQPPSYAPQPAPVQPLERTPQPQQPQQPQQPEPAPTKASYGPQSPEACGQRRQVARPEGLSPGQAAPGEYPWQAIVASRADRNPICGAAVLSKDAVITAAHCVHGMEPSDLMVIAGEHLMGVPNPGAQESSVAAIARHPDFNPASLFNDHAVLRLAEPLTLGESVGPVCLPEASGQANLANPGQPASQDCVATGWGLKALKGNHVGSGMNAVPARLMSAEEAERHLRRTFLGPNFQMHKSQVCALATKAETNLCMVDPGGPLACPKADGAMVLAGVYSWDVGCHPSMVSAPEGPMSPTAFSAVDADWVRRVLAEPIQNLVQESRNEVLRKQQQEKQPDHAKPGFDQGYGK